MCAGTNFLALCQDLYRLKDVFLWRCVLIVCVVVLHLHDEIIMGETCLI